MPWAACIPQTIIDQDADYVLSLKATQSTLYEGAKLFLCGLRQSQFTGITLSSHETADAEHVRSVTSEQARRTRSESVPFVAA